MPTNQQEPFGAFGGFLGIPKGVDNREELIKHKRQLQVEKFKENAADMALNMQPADRQTFQIFAQLGEAVSSKLQGGAKLSDDDEDAMKIIEASNKKMQALVGTPAFEKLTPIERSFQMHQIVADETVRGGDFETYSELVTDLFHKKMAHKQANLEQRKLELDVDAQEQTNEASAFDFANLQESIASGQPAQMVKMVNGSPDLDAPVTVMQDPVTGKLMDEDGKQLSFNEVMPLDAALDLAKAQDEIGGSKLDGFVTLEKFVGVSEGSKLRGQLTDVSASIETIDRAVTAFEGSIDPQTITGTQGGILNFANNLINTVQGTAKNIRVFAQEDASGNGTGDSRSLVDAADDFISDEEVPAQFRGNSAAQIQYKSAVMQLLYSDARLEEPGARQLSDADIAAAKDRLGVSSGDPAAVLANLNSVMLKRLDKTLFHFDNIKGMARARGLRPELAVRRIVGRDPTEELQKQRDRLAEIINRGNATVEFPIDPSQAPGAESKSFGEQNDALINEFL